MNFIVSFFLALTALIATLGLQLCNDGVNPNKGVVAPGSVVAILAALYLVDYKKFFAISRRVCNILLVAVVFSQSGALFRSRQDFLAFSIANILALLQAVVFFQRKTTRIACQILVISLIEVAVGCVFQSSLYFVATVPLYVLFAFLSLSLLFLKGERNYYATHIALKERFSKRKKSRAGAGKNKAEPGIDLAETNLTLATDLLKRASTSNVSGKRFLFFACPTSANYGVAFEYFKRFAIWSVGGALCSALFFCLFPRFNQIGYGAFQFEAVDWSGGGASVPRLARTGFKGMIELGDLGPAIDSCEQVATVRFYPLDDVKRDEALDSESPVYFRGVALTSYADRCWRELDGSTEIQNASLLARALQTQTALKNIEDVLPQELLLAAKKRRESRSDRPSETDRWGRPVEPYRFPPANRFDFREQRSEELFRAPLLGYNPKPLSDFGSIKFSDRRDDHILLDELKSQIRSFEDAIKYDANSELIAAKMEYEPTDVPYFFHIRPFFVVDGSAPLISTLNSSVVARSRPRGDFAGKKRFWFVSPAFHDGRQDVLTPNQENVWSNLVEYLRIDVGRFPRLIELARQWDSESGCDPNDFVARARFFERKLRDSGEFRYNRSGVLRDPALDPLEDFVSERREGHCEYFAGALALMLRAVGVPARVVVGYACDVESKKLVVRQSDAHSWVEAYIPPKQLSRAASHPTSDLNVDPNAKWLVDGGWLRLDPTPAADREAEQPSALAAGAHDWSSFVQSLGRDFVLNLNGARQQRNIYAPIVVAFRTIAGCFASLKNAFSGAGKFPHRFVLLLLAIFVLTLALRRRFPNASLKFPWKRFKRVAKSGTSKRETVVDKGTISLFLQIAQALERRLKITRRRGETPMEFVARCLEEDKKKVATPLSTDPQPREWTNMAVDVAKSYYQASFGNAPVPPQEKKRWKELLRALKG